MAHIAARGEPSLFVIEKNHLLEALTNPESMYTPLLGSVVMVTEEIEGAPARKVITPEGKCEQQVERVYDYLKQKGVSELRIAGEWATWRLLGIFKGGCVYDFLKHFPGFQVRGVEGCVFPLNNPSGEQGSILWKLYDEAVKIEGVTGK